MKPDDYIDNVMKTESRDIEAIITRISSVATIRLDHAADGLCTEAGEFKDSLKKYKFYGKPVDAINLIEELGDILWYIAVAADVLNYSFEEIMEININKLKSRYGEKFNEEGALNRDLDKEKNILEQKTPIKLITNSELRTRDMEGIFVNDCNDCVPGDANNASLFCGIHRRLKHVNKI